MESIGKIRTGTHGKLPETEAQLYWGNLATVTTYSSIGDRAGQIFRVVDVATSSP